MKKGPQALIDGCRHQRPAGIGSHVRANCPQMVQDSCEVKR